MTEVSAFRPAQRRLAAVKTKLPLAQASEHFSKPRQEILEVGGIHVDVVQERLDAERLDILENDLRHGLLKVRRQAVKPKRCCLRCEQAIFGDDTQQLRSTLRQSNLMIPRARIRCCKVLGSGQSLRHILDVLGRVNALLCAAIHFTIVSTDAPSIRPLVRLLGGHNW